MDTTRVRCTDCGWQGLGYQLAAQACPICDGRVGEDGSPEYEGAAQQAAFRAAILELAKEDLQAPLAYTVYILFHETNCGKFDDSDGYIESVYQTEALAEAAKLKAIREAIENGREVYWNPDAEEGEEESDGDWTDDWRIERHQILMAVPETVTIY